MIQFRIAIAALCLLPVFLYRYRTRLSWQLMGHLTLVGLTNSAIPFCLLAYATLHVSAGYTSLLNSSVPLWSAIIAAVWLGDWLTRWQVVGIALGFLGVFVLVLGKGELSFTGPTLAIIAATLATISYGYSANYTKRYLTGVPVMVIVTISLVVSSLCMLPFTWYYWPSHEIQASSWWNVLILGAVCTALAYLFFYGLMSRVGPTKTVSVTFLVPAFGVFWGYWFLDESITIHMIIGCAIIFSGTALAIGLYKPGNQRKVSYEEG